MFLDDSPCIFTKSVLILVRQREAIHQVFKKALSFYLSASSAAEITLNACLQLLRYEKPHITLIASHYNRF